MSAATKQLHTPTPWKLNTFEGLLVYGCKGGRTAKACGIDDAQAVANAAFIVRAVNSFAELSAKAEAHAELVAALVSARGLIIDQVEASGHSLAGPTDWREIEDDTPKAICQARALVAEISAALFKAKGVQP